MSYWIDEADLFLYVKGTGLDDVHLWRCKKPASSSSSSSSSSSLVVPMKPDDFDYVSNVKNHLELIGDLFDWDETDYKRLVKYIYEKRLLVNCHGFVIAELPHKTDKDGNKTIDDANEEDVPAIYIRSLDVLPLKPYIPNLLEQPIPLRTVKLLGDVNGKAAVMKEDSNVTKLTARVDDLESDLATTTGNVADLQSKNKNLEAENKTLDSNAKTLEEKVTKLIADLVTQMTALQQQVKNIIITISKEVWMNDITNSEWVGAEGLNVRGPYDDLTIVDRKSIFTVDDSSTNVRARYWYKVDKALLSIEEDAERIYKYERGFLLEDEAASTRDAMYEQAEFIEREMEQMPEHIKSIIQTLNASRGGDLDAIDGMNPLDVVVRILNNQLSSLVD